LAPTRNRTVQQALSRWPNLFDDAAEVYVRNPTHVGDDLIIRWRFSSGLMHTLLSPGFQVNAAFFLRPAAGSPDIPVWNHDGVPMTASASADEDTGWLTETVPVAATPPMFYSARPSPWFIELRVSGGEQGHTWTAQSTFFVTLDGVGGDWWSWDDPAPQRVAWNASYNPSGRLTNRAKTTLTDVRLQRWEGDSGAGDVHVYSVAPGGSAHAPFGDLKQSWSWLTPGVWVPRGPFEQTFTYTVDISAYDQFMNVYPTATSSTKSVLIEVSQAKRFAAATAAGETAAAVALLIIAAGFFAGFFTAAIGAVFVAAAAGAYGLASISAAVAQDPPEPDIEFTDPVRLIPPAIPESVLHDPIVGPLGELLGLVGWFAAADLVSSQIEGRRLGAIAAGDRKAGETQRASFQLLREEYVDRVARLEAAIRRARDAVTGFEDPHVARLQRLRKEMGRDGLPEALVRAMEQAGLEWATILGLDLAMRDPDLLAMDLNLADSVKVIGRAASKWCALSIAEHSTMGQA
jgi:hypothetical protein